MAKPEKATATLVPFGNGFEAATEFNRRAIEQALKVNEALIDGTLAAWQEIFSLAKLRIHENLEVWQALAQCSSAESAVECQQRFAEKATSQYLEAAHKLTMVLTRTAAAPCAPHFVAPAKVESATLPKAASKS